MAAGLRHTEARGRLSVLRRQSRDLEARHREYQRALSALPHAALYNIGDTAFLKLDAASCETVLKAESTRLFQEVENVQREIVKLERELMLIEIQAGLDTLLEG